MDPPCRAVVDVAPRLAPWAYDGRMRRLMPVIPHGPRRRAWTEGATADWLLACPRISPEWELGALRALMKPQTKQGIVHRPAAQAWPTDAAARVEAGRALVRERLGYDPPIAFQPAGDFHFVASVSPSDRPVALALAVVLSMALPGAWVVLGRLFVRDGRFFRRNRRFKIDLVPASNVHLPRSVRAALALRRGRVPRG